MHTTFLTLLALAGTITPLATASFTGFDHVHQHHERMALHRRASLSVQDAAVYGAVEQDVDETLHQGWKRAMGPAWSSAPTLQTSRVSASVGAMQLTVGYSLHTLYEAQCLFRSSARIRCCTLRPAERRWILR